MSTFHWSELLVVFIGGLILFFGLALLMLRRRNEVLQQFLTPEDPHLEEDFFRVRRSPEETLPEGKETAEEERMAETSEEDVIQWGIANSDWASGS